MKIGVTGTKVGMSFNQIKNLKMFFSKFNSQEYIEIHHGDCVGCDSEVVEMFRNTFENIKIVCHPPLDDKHQAFVESDETFEKRDYLDRNHDIVKCVELVLVFPAQNEEVVRSGTWATFRYAKEHKSDIIIFYPNGEIEQINEL